MSRKSWPGNVKADILIRSRRICALCFYFKNDSRVKIRGQIAHIDRDSSNSAIGNGAYLCKNHHDQYDMVSLQSVRIDPEELKQAQANLHELVKAGGLPSSEKKLAPRPRQPKRLGVSLDVYARRLPIYKATVEFIRYVVGDLRPGYPQIIKFGHDTEEALFLFDERIAEYLRTLSHRAVRLHGVVMMREAAGKRGVGNFESMVTEETDLATWFTEQYDETRRRFSPFLRLI